MKANILKRYLLTQNLIFYLFALLIAFGLKYHYSHADSDDLVWILAPTASLVEIVMPVTFEPEQGQGFICSKNSIIIAPACAGVNFMIISFCMIAFYGIYRLNYITEKFLWLFFSLAAAFVLTLVVNTFRIILSINLYESGFSMGWFTPSRIHLAAGIIIYVSCLYIAYFTIRLILSKYQLNIAKKTPDQTKTPLQPFAGKRNLSILIPIIWYWLITLGIPLVYGWYKKSINLFEEYTAVLIILCTAICLAFFCFQLFYVKLKDKIASNKKSDLRTILYHNNSNKL